MQDGSCQRCNKYHTYACLEEHCNAESLPGDGVPVWTEYGSCEWCSADSLDPCPEAKCNAQSLLLTTTSTATATADYCYILLLPATVLLLTATQNCYKPLNDYPSPQ